MEIIHKIGKTEINNEELDKQVSKILETLKTKKQTYAINKFVLEQAILMLQETIV